VKVSYVEGVASHNDLESCGATRKGGVEALTEERAGWVLSRQIMTLLRKQQALQVPPDRVSLARTLCTLLSHRLTLAGRDKSSNS
jgi:hypothetical protein